VDFSLVQVLDGMRLGVQESISSCHAE
jgi:hypothetical protein